ncbi:hemicentin-2-like [Mytilus trossulus]|uniref:hemicentin-2-like n=1 Tax=Mytilus trossulus TaxID=6551 RepID=UPI003006F3F4
MYCCLRRRVASGNVGGSITLQCFLNKSRSRYFWQRANSKDGFYKYLSIDDNKYEMLQNKHLKINYLTFDDSDYYRCTATTTQETGLKQELTVNGIPVVHTEPSYKVLRNSQVKLRCYTHTKTSPTITNVSWQKKTKWVSSFSSIQYGNTKYSGGTVADPSLTIKNLEDADGGTYRCLLQNNRGEGFSDTELDVGDLPVVLIPQLDYYPTRTKTLEISCYIGNSDSVRWQKQSQPIDLASYKYSGGTFASPNLTIYNIWYTDDGEYECCGTNNYGESCDSCNVQSGHKPTLTKSNENVSAKISTKFVLGVTITSSTPAPLSVYWYKSSLHISGSRYHGGTSSIPSLTINTVRATDDGTYTCTVYNGVGSASVDINLITWNTPSVSFSGNQDLAVGSEAFIQVRVTSKPDVKRITWKKETVPINFSDTTKYQNSGSLQNPQLKIVDVQVSDKGTYSCSAYNGYDTGTGTVQINVGEITEATILTEYYVTIVGEEITLECLIKNETSERKLYWLRGAKYVDLYLTNKYSHGTLNQPSLTIKNIETSDAGNYTCKLENKFGHSEDTVVLKVLFVQVYPPLQLSPKANDSVILPCYAYGGNRVTWRRNGKKINTTGSSEYSESTVNNPQLTISKVTRNHAGNYTCETSYGSVSATSDTQLQLNVKDIPLVLQWSNNIPASTGDNIQLECNHASYPESSLVFWNRDGEKINVSDSKYNGGTINEPSLTIINTEQKDSGIYMCAVVNGIGTGYSSEIQLIVKDPEMTNGALKSVVGGVTGTIFVLVAVFIIFIVFRR